MKVTEVKMEKLATGRKRIWSFASLFFSLFFFVPYFVYADYANPGSAFIGIAIFCCFFGTYLAAVYSSTDKVHWAVMGILFVAVLGTRMNPASLIFFGYSAFIVGYHYRKSKALTWLVIIIAVQVYAVLWARIWEPAFIYTPMLSIVGLFTFGAMERREALFRLSEQEANSQIEQVSAIAERERISRDLHDLVGHSLSSIALKAELAEKLLEREHYDKARGELSELAQLSRTVLSDVRKAVSNIKQKDLQSELLRLEKELEGQGFSVDTNIEFPELSAVEESNMILIAKETVTNILRHSKGQHVRIQLHEEKGELHYLIADDGDSDKAQFGNGLNGIVERLKGLGGILDVQQNNGFILSITMPLGAQHD